MLQGLTTDGVSAGPATPISPVRGASSDRVDDLIQRANERAICCERAATAAAAAAAAIYDCPTSPPSSIVNTATRWFYHGTM